MPAELLPWPPAHPNWDSETGEALKILAERSPCPLSIVLFGSGALDFTLPFSIKSVDTDIHPDIVYGKAGHTNTDRETLCQIVRDLGLGMGQQKKYVQVCAPNAFETLPRWDKRAKTYSHIQLEVTVPHPFDILVAKALRGDEKDISDFQRVFNETGHPTEHELIEELQRGYQLFNVQGDEQVHIPGQHTNKYKGSRKDSVRRVWKQIYGRQVNLEQEVIRPGKAMASESFEPRKSISSLIESLDRELDI